MIQLLYSFCEFSSGRCLRTRLILEIFPVLVWQASSCNPKMFIHFFFFFFLSMWFIIFIQKYSHFYIFLNYSSNGSQSENYLVWKHCLVLFRLLFFFFFYLNVYGISSVVPCIFPWKNRFNTSQTLYQVFMQFLAAEVYRSLDTILDENLLQEVSTG